MVAWNAYARNAIARYIGTEMTNGYLEIYDASSTVLLRMHLPVDAWADNEAGGQQLAGMWFGTVHHAGVAATFKIRSDFVEGPSTWVVTGTVSGPGGGGDMVLDSTTLVYGDNIDILSCELAI